MKYFYDAEFIEDGKVIDLVSIAVVCEDGREYYAVSTEFDPERAGPWVRKNVLPKLPSPSSPLWRSRRQIRDELYKFLVPRPTVQPELWAWVGAYDHVVLCQLWGSMVDLPPAAADASAAAAAQAASTRAERTSRPRVESDSGPASRVSGQWLCLPP